tara:strand:- start:105 stop:971 length:867 start_codon:yes stop_codon:yes gene_type:complete
MTNRRQILGLALSGLLSSSFLKANPFERKKNEALPNFLACNMESWWTELPFLDRFRAAAGMGFKSVEFWSHSDPTRDMRKVAKLCKSLDLNIIQFTGWQGPSLASINNHNAFTDAIKKALEIAHLLDAPMFTVVGHQTFNKVNHKESVGNLFKALEKVAPILQTTGKTLILEPFNPIDHEGHFLNGSVDALSICRSIDSPNIKINWDLYHMQLSEGNLIENIKLGLDQIGYIQVADVPGRNEPGTGEINYKFVFEQLKEFNYNGFIGLECWPKKQNNSRAIKNILQVI